MSLVFFNRKKNFHQQLIVISNNENLNFFLIIVNLLQKKVFDFDISKFHEKVQKIQIKYKVKMIKKTANFEPKPVP